MGSLGARIPRAIGILLTLFVLHTVGQSVLTGYRTRDAKPQGWLYSLLGLSVVLIALVRVLGLALIQYVDKSFVGAATEDTTE